MRIGVRGKIFVVSVLLVLTVVAVSGAYLERVLRQWTQERIETELLNLAQMVRVMVEREGTVEPARIDPLADRVGDPKSGRVTVIDEGGQVIGDSNFDVPDLAGLESHRERPEVVAALAGGQGIARRYSMSLGTDMLYVALPFDGPGGRGIVRVARPLSEVEAAVGRLRLALMIAGAIGLVGAVVMSAFASHFLSRTLRSLVQDARQMAEGGEVRPLAIASQDEIGGLAGSINRLADELESTVATLAAERSRFEAVLESMDEAVIALDQHQHLTMVNRAAVALLSLSVGGGSTLRERIRIPALHELVERALAGQAGRGEFEIPEPTPRRIMAYASPLRNATGAVVVMHDVTEIRRLETIRRDFVANVSHELRTPVSIIRANAETLLDGALERPDIARRFLDAVLRNADRLAALVGDLLEISRIEAGTYELNSDAVQVAPIVERIVDSVENLAQDKKINVINEVAEGTVVWADPAALEQILLNLVDNAVKYTQEGGSIVVASRPAGEGTVRLEVRDNGPGIAAKHRTRIFERFYRVDPGRSREVGGTGLGLAIVTHLVEAMDGHVGVDAVAPRGSAFWLSLPSNG
ncbi:MAG: HAMP domain-containing protein [Myxococcales bacterium]|nr:HAMP domain-containing protein [Myxococcales bacterium]